MNSQNLKMEELRYSVSYICPPCGCPKDNQNFESPGTCIHCNMTFTARVKGLEDKPFKDYSRKSVAILLFDMADIMDVTGPMSVFEHAGFNVITVAKDGMPKDVGMSLTITPDYTFESLPNVDIIMVPGGGPAEQNQDMDIVNWLKDRNDKTDTMFSVCSGAFFLGLAGILDRNEATTFASLIPNLKEQFPKAKVLDNVKYTNNDHVFTSSGLSSGIDASFEVVAKYYGIGRAQDIANRMEYPWKRKNDYARTQLADNYIIQFNNLIRQFSTDFTFSQGDMNQWEYRFTLWEGVNINDFTKFIHDQMNAIEGLNTKPIVDNGFNAFYNHKNLGLGRITFQIDKTNESIQVTLKVKRENPIDLNSNNDAL